MIRHATEFQTARAAIYLQQLCKHFGHKVPVKADSEHGEIELPMGHCSLRVKAQSLRIETEAATESDARRLTTVVGSHLERFAFRDNPKIEWIETQQT